MMSVFKTLNELNVNEHTETKKSGGTELTYLSWPWAWAEVKKRYPEAHYTIWKDADGRPYAFDPLTGYMVYTSVTIGDESHDMWLPVMDGANNAMKAEPYEYKVKNPKFRYAKWNDHRKKYLDSYGNEQPEYLVKRVAAATMFDINKTIMRCLVKNLAMFGLGLYIYAGEDLPDGEGDSSAQPEDPIPRTGSTEAAQAAGHAKLEKLNAQMEEAVKAQGAATDEQKKYIADHANDADYMNIMQKYGANLERLSASGAEKVIARIDANNAAAGENA